LPAFQTKGIIVLTTTLLRGNIMAHNLAVQEVMTPPYLLLWLRYSAFIPLYPLGVASELTMASLALPVIRVHRPLTLDMPNALNWSFDYYYFCWAAIACYLPGGALLPNLACLLLPVCATGPGSDISAILVCWKFYLGDITVSPDELLACFASSALSNGKYLLVLVWIIGMILLIGA
jgi:hypothetical protein